MPSPSQEENNNSGYYSSRRRCFASLRPDFRLTMAVLGDDWMSTQKSLIPASQVSFGSASTAELVFDGRDRPRAAPKYPNIGD